MAWSLQIKVGSPRCDPQTALDYATQEVCLRWEVLYRLHYTDKRTLLQGAHVSIASCFVLMLQRYVWYRTLLVDKERVRFCKSMGYDIVSRRNKVKSYNFEISGLLTLYIMFGIDP